MNPAEIIRHRVLLFLQAGMTYEQAISRAHMEGAAQMAIHVDGRPLGAQED